MSLTHFFPLILLITRTCGRLLRASLVPRPFEDICTRQKQLQGARPWGRRLEFRWFPFGSRFPCARAQGNRLLIHGLRRYFEFILCLILVYYRFIFTFWQDGDSAWFNLLYFVVVQVDPIIYLPLRIGSSSHGPLATWFSAGDGWVSITSLWTRQWWLLSKLRNQHKTNISIKPYYSNC